MKKFNSATLWNDIKYLLKSYIDLALLYIKLQHFHSYEVLQKYALMPVLV